MATQVAQNWKLLKHKKVVDCLNDVFHGILMQSGFVFDAVNHNVYADISASELTTANGYTSGGAVLSGVACVRDDTNKLVALSWSNQTFTASGGSLVAAGMMILDWTVGSPLKPIVQYIDFGGNQTAVAGQGITVSNIQVTEQ